MVLAESVLHPRSAWWVLGLLAACALPDEPTGPVDTHSHTEPPAVEEVELPMLEEGDYTPSTHNFFLAMMGGSEFVAYLTTAFQGPLDLEREGCIDGDIWRLDVTRARPLLAEATLTLDETEVVLTPLEEVDRVTGTRGEGAEPGQEVALEGASIGEIPAPLEAATIERPETGAWQLVRWEPRDRGEKIWINVGFSNLGGRHMTCQVDDDGAAAIPEPPEGVELDVELVAVRLAWVDVADQPVFSSLQSESVRPSRAGD